MASTISQTQRSGCAKISEDLSPDKAVVAPSSAHVGFKENRSNLQDT